MSWHLTHCYIGAPCEAGEPHVSRRSHRIGRLLQRRHVTGQCEKDMGLGIGQSLRDHVEQLLTSRGFPVDHSNGDSPWLWCLGGPEAYRQPISQEELNDLKTGSCIDLNLYVCETHQSVSAQIEHIDAVPEWGGSGQHDPRQSNPIPLGISSQVVEAAMGQLTKWLEEEIISPDEAQASA